MTAGAPPPKPGPDDPGESIARGLGQAVLAVVVVSLLSFVIPALTGWDPPYVVLVVLGALVLVLIFGAFRRRPEERPYEQHLEELRAEVGEAQLSVSERAPPRSE